MKLKVDASITTAAISGTVLSATGTALQTSEILQWISLGITILGAVISFIVIPLLDWVKKQKDTDDKTTIDDVKELVENVKSGLDNVRDVIDKSTEKEDSENGSNQGTDD